MAQHGAVGELKADEAKVEPKGNTASAQPAQIRMTVSITRKATGETKTYELVGTPAGESRQQQLEKD